MKSKENFWIPAFAGMTRFGGLPFELAHVRFVHISPNFASPEGEGFPPSPMVILKAMESYSWSDGATA
jgi:hypothetical protein